MRCDVLLFAELAEAIGRDRLEVELPGDATVADALERLAAEHEPVARLRDVLAVAVNERYAAGTDVLRGGDTIALIPPVSGG